MRMGSGKSHHWLHFPFWRVFRICSRICSILSILRSSCCWWAWSLAWLAVIVCWLVKSRSIWTSVAFRRTSADEGSPVGTFSVCWLWLAEDCWGSKIAGVAVLSYIGVEVSLWGDRSSRKFLRGYGSRLVGALECSEMQSQIQQQQL